MTSPIDIAVQRKTRSAAKKPLTKADLAAAAKLKEMWLAHKAATSATQITACDAMGMNQSSFSNYLRGEIPIGRTALAKFSAYFNCAPCDIRQEYIPSELIDDLVRTRALLRRLLDAAKPRTAGEPMLVEIVTESENFLALHDGEGPLSGVALTQ